MSWYFIHEALMDAGLNEGLIKLIMSCVTSTAFQVLWNGEATTEFLPSRGLRQGDPLSPYLFVLGMERLSHIIQSKIVEG